jgi:hypothetical protein
MKAPITVAQAMAHPAVVETINALAAMANEQRESIMSDAQKPVDDEIIKEIERAIVDHCTGGDLWLCAKLGKDRIKNLLSPPTLTPPDGWETAVGLASSSSVVMSSSLATLRLKILAKAILDIDVKIKELK